jgi:predicted HTH transcriptional regulator
MNSETGGTLIIGLSDSKEVLGLQVDYASFKSLKPDRDGFEQAFCQVLIAAVGERRCVRWVRTRFCSLLGKELCVVTVAPSNEPVFLEGEASGQLFVRIGNSTRPLDAKEALAYSRDRWGRFALPRWHTHKPIPHPAG